MSQPTPDVVRKVHADGIACRNCGAKEFIDRVAASPWWTGQVEVMEGTHWLILGEDGRQIGSMPITVDEADEVRCRN